MPAVGQTAAIEGFRPPTQETRLRVKTKAPRQTVCNEPGTTKKQSFCGGKLKRITELEPEVAKQAAKGQDVLRCQICEILYVEASPYATAKR